MDHAFSPMSTANANAIVPDASEQKSNGLRSFQLSPTKTFDDRDLENVPHDVSVEPPSSPLQGEVTFNMDDTHFSAFSAVPNHDMTQFAQLRQSPQRKSPIKSRPQTPHGGDTTQSTVCRTPRNIRPKHDQVEHSASPTPRRPKSRHDGDTTNLLLDFTEQIDGFAIPAPIPPSRRISPLKTSRAQPDLASYAADLRTPSPKKSSRHDYANLLDFDITPAQTPRSRLSHSTREVEAMKSEFQAQITSLKATLSGKEAEVASLKDYVNTAERRAGEAQEELREGRNRIEDLEAQKLEWERRDKEMQDACRSVKQEILHSEQERENLEKNLHEAESRAIEAESKLSAGIPSAIPVNSSATSTDPNLTTPHAPPVAGSAEVDAAVERVARELHALYKSKHETKVKALKKSYEARWEKKITDLSAKVIDLTKENEDLKLGRDATMSSVVPGIVASGAPSQPTNSPSKRASTFVEDFAMASQRLQEEHAAALATLSSQLEGTEAEKESLSSQLEALRTEMAELVAATEEMITLQAEQSMLANQPLVEPAEAVPRSTQRPPQTSSSFSRSLSGLGSGSTNGAASSGMTPRSRPQSGSGVESRIGRGGFGATRSFGRSGIMSNIERMGRGRQE